jgi:hypothetical protein
MNTIAIAIAISAGIFLAIFLSFLPLFLVRRESSGGARPHTPYG